jgi:hypothetical protein
VSHFPYLVSDLVDPSAFPLGQSGLLLLLQVLSKLFALLAALLFFFLGLLSHRMVRKSREGRIRVREDELRKRLRAQSLAFYSDGHAYRTLSSSRESIS